MKNNAPNRMNWLFPLLFALCAAGGVGVFTRAFPEWNPMLYVLSVLLLAVSFGGLLYLIRTGKRPLRAALLGGGVFTAACFGVVFLINNVILREVQPKLATFIMTVVFMVVFTALTALASAHVKTGRLPPILTTVFAALLFAPYISGTVQAVLPERYEHPFTDKIAQTEGLAMAKNETKLIVNADDSHWWGFFNRLAENGTFDDEAMNVYVEQYADSGVTDVMFNIFCQSSDVPSEVMTFRGDLYGQTEQNGAPVDYANYYGLNEIYNVQKKDIFAVWFEKCREVGLRPWISLRMNDCHDPDEETSQLRGDLFYTARENGWMIGEEYGYFRNCLNYAVPEVREIMLDYIREQLAHYDVYGLELDFMREIYCFDYLHADSEEICGTMNGFIREAAQLVREAENARGHEIKLAVRLMRDLDQCRVFGFDPETWCGEGLVDAITVTPRFSSCDSAMPIADWRARLPGVEIWAGIETLINRQAEGSTASPEAVRGYAAQYLTAGADGAYLFNYMSSGTVGKREREVYDTCGTLSTILSLPRRHIVTYQDTAPAGWEPYRPLPLKVKKNAPAGLKLETGAIPEGAAVSLLIGTNKPLKDGAALTLTVNGAPCAFIGEDEVQGLAESDGGPVPGGYAPEGAHIYRYTLSDASALPNLQTLAFTGDGIQIVYVELDVSPTRTQP